MHDCVISIHFVVVLLAVLSLCSLQPASGLQIYAFRDASAFFLAKLATDHPTLRKTLNVTYVANADEAHSVLASQQADLVFMSYDDTLSMALEDGNANVTALWPVHGGILSLCGKIKPNDPNLAVGIDTQSGYARVLKHYLKSRYDNATYTRILEHLVISGATNLRYNKLVNGSLDATLLNPPFSVCAANRKNLRACTSLAAPTAAFKGGCTSLQSEGPYQGVVVNAHKHFLANYTNCLAVKELRDAWHSTVTSVHTNTKATERELKAFYNVTAALAKQLAAALFQPNGFQTTLEFDGPSLSGTERYFEEVTGMAVSGNRSWVGSSLPC